METELNKYKGEIDSSIKSSDDTNDVNNTKTSHDLIFYVNGKEVRFLVKHKTSIAFIVENSYF